MHINTIHSQYHKITTIACLVVLLLQSISIIGNNSVSLNALEPGFEENKGQFNWPGIDEKIFFQTKNGNSVMYITNTGIDYFFYKTNKNEKIKEKDFSGQKKSEGVKEIEWCKVSMLLEGAILSENNLIKGNIKFDKVLNYYKENSLEGVTGISVYSKVIFNNIYPGIDWVLYYNESGLKYDFIVHPGADASLIKMTYIGAVENMSLSKNNKSVIVQSPLGKITEGDLYCYQDNINNSIYSIYKIENNHISFAIENYNTSQPLVIDPPVLMWSTYYGGGEAEGPLDMCVDKNGDVYITGYSYAVLFPLFAQAGAFNQSTVSGTTMYGFLPTDIFIIKFNSARNILWATFYGGSKSDTGYGVAIDNSNNLLVTGTTYSADLPLQSWTGAHNDATLGGTIDAFVLKFNVGGGRLWATYYGAQGSFEEGYDIAIDKNNNIYIVGATQSTNLPIVTPTGGYSQTTLGGGFGRDAFICGFNSLGALRWSTYYGGNQWEMPSSVHTDDCGNIYITGWTRSADFSLQNLPGAYNQSVFNGSASISDAFILKFNSSCQRLWATYYGGSGNDNGSSIRTDIKGNIYVVGSTGSTNFPLQTLIGAYNDASYNGGFSDSYILKFDKNCARVWSTFFGGNGDDYFGDITINDLQEVYISGTTSSTNYPTAQPLGAFFQPGFGGSWNDITVTKLSTNNALQWSTYFGGADNEWCTGMALNKNAGALYLTGEFANPTAAHLSPTLNPGGGAYFQTGPIGSVNKHSACIIEFSDPIIPPVIDFTSNDVCPMQAANFIYTGTLDTTAVTKWKWLYGDPSSGSADSSHTKNSSHTYANPGTYSVSLIAYYECESDTIIKTITVFPFPVANAGNDSTVCAGSNITLNGSGGINYLWTPSATLSTNTIFNPIASPAANTVYTLIVTDSNGCTATDSILITMAPLPILNTSFTPDYCNLSTGTASVTVSNGYAPYSYFWAGTVANQNNVSNLMAGTYSITVTNAAGCSTTSTINISSVSAFTTSVSQTNATCSGYANGTASINTSISGNTFSYNWNNGQTTNTATGLSAGIYTCTITDSEGCSLQTNITITEPSVLSSAINTVNPFCHNGNNGNAVSIPSGGTSPYTYLWSNNQTTINATGLSSGSHSLTTTDNNGCFVTQSFLINNPPPFAVSISPVNAVCPGQQVPLNTFISGGTAAYNYSWSNGQTGNTINPSVYSNTIISVFVVDANGCTTDDSILITTHSLPVVSFSSDITSGCTPLCVNFLNTTNNSATQVWNFGNNVISSQANPINCYSQAGNYSVSLTVMDANGCSNTLVQNNYISIHPNPTAAFTPQPATASLINPTIHFNNQSTGSTAWQWSFGDVNNGTSSLQHTNYTYSDTGKHEVVLVAYNEFGCTDTAFYTISIDADFILYVPNSFTPNGDGLNDIFIPTGTGLDIEDFEFYIYDRWGMLIFQSYSTSIGWDGTVNGASELAQQDTYVWLVRVKDNSGKKHRYVGHVNLIR